MRNVFFGPLMRRSRSKAVSLRLARKDSYSGVLGTSPEEALKLGSGHVDALKQEDICVDSSEICLASKIMADVSLLGNGGLLASD